MLSWLGWGLLLVVQNIAFTFVSRARNSASLPRHLISSLFSNGVWFASQMILTGKFMVLLGGGHGLLPTIGTGLFYTIMTLTGALVAHKIALLTERARRR